MIRISPASVVLSAALIATSAGAQTLRGVVVDRGDRPVSGVVIMLVDSASTNVAARGLTNDRGEFRLTTAKDGSYQVRTLRIGFRPTLSGTFALSKSAEVSRRIVLTDVPVLLDTVRATSKSVCGAFTDAGAATYAVWEQVRAALTATEITAASGNITATTVAFERTLKTPATRDPDQLPRPTFRVSTGVDARIWRTLSPDSLHKAGYVINGRDGSVSYYAPGLDMLLSNLFVEDHCFHLTTQRGSSGLLGIAFEPTAERRRTPEVRGTLWLDRATSELRRLEYRYSNIPRDQQDNAKGELAFARLREGTWVITDWSIRMPLLEMEVGGALYGNRVDTRVAAIRVSGGLLAFARRDSDTLWARPPFSIGGVVRDSLSGSSITGARVSIAGSSIRSTSDREGRFTLTGVRPGQYTVVTRTSSLDSMNTSHQQQFTIADDSESLELRVPSGRMLAEAVCGRGGLRDPSTAIIVGEVRLRRDSTTRRFPGLHVFAEWSADTTDPTHLKRLDAAVLPNGSFRLCGVPVNAALSLSAKTDSAETAQPVVARIPSDLRLARATLFLDRLDDLAALGATFTGSVMTDSSRRPIVGAEVVFPELGKSTMTDARGDFRITGIPAGEHQVTIRRLGYGAADTRLTFAGHETVDRRIVLGSAVVLETMTVSEHASERTMPGFEDHRRLGFGTFYTRSEIAKYEGMPIGSLLQQFPAANVINDRGHTFVVTRRPRIKLCQIVGQCPDTPCYSLVYVDGVLMNGIQEPTEPYDLMSIALDKIEAIEYYDGPATTPLEYSRMASECGVLVIWTRRGP